MYESVKKMLIRHEGIKLSAYLDTENKWTIGVGRNIDDYGFTDEEIERLGLTQEMLNNPKSLKISESAAYYLLDNNIREIDELLMHFIWYTQMNEARKDAIIDMVFNMGYPKFSRFDKTIEFLQEQKYFQAADEMLNSIWYRKLKKRPMEISKMIALGRYLTKEELTNIWGY